MLADHVSVGVCGWMLVGTLFSHRTVPFLPCSAKRPILVESEVMLPLEEVTEGKVPCIIAGCGAVGCVDRGGCQGRHNVRAHSLVEVRKETVFMAVIQCST